MKKIYSILFFLICVCTTYAQDVVTQANEAYEQEDFKKAIELYETALKEQGKSADLYYNLGNAYYKDNHYAEAILNYERALLLSPGDEDVRFNLDMAKSHITDKIEPVETFFLTMWFHSVRDSLSSNAWAVVGIVSFLLIIVCLFLYFFTRIVVLKKIGYFLGLILVLVTIIANNFAFSLKDKLTDREEAIIFAPTITVKSSPADSGTDLFILHEGTKVSVLSTVGEWSEIKLSDGNRGWMPTGKLRII